MYLFHMILWAKSQMPWKPGTEQLFSITPLPNAHEKNGQSSALTGAFRIGRCFLHGGQMDFLPQSESEENHFAFPCQKRTDGIEVWPGGAMLHVDAMIRPHILTRIKGHEVCEYTRFRAEANTVLVQTNSGITTMLSEPAKAEYITTQEEPPPITVPVSVTTDLMQTVAKEQMTMSGALEAIRSEDYDTAISFFGALTRERPTYHIAWLRLGYSRREKAVRLAPSDPNSAIELLKLSLDDFRNAAQHVDIEYQAQAWYERSKSLYHLAKLEPLSEAYRRECAEDGN